MSEDFYHDDPVEEVSKTKVRSKLFTTAFVVIGSIFFFQSTLAGNISLNSGRGIEFGQSVSQAVACSGATNLTLTPRSSFTNGSGSSGTHYFNSVTVSNIPSSCYGVDFTISAYNDSSSTPLALFNSTSTSAVVYNNAGAFSPGIGSCNMTVASSTGTFTATFTTPVAQSSSVFKLTIQSGLNTPFKVGDRGPGCGIVYYVSAAPFTSTGSTCNTTCKYLEAAPNTWSGGSSDPTLTWATYYNQGRAVTGADGTVIGTGYQNSLDIQNQNGNVAATSAAVAAMAYRGSGLADWFLPSKDELAQLYSQKATVGDFVASIYSSSSETSEVQAWSQLFTNGSQFSVYDKVNPFYVRPVRAF